ncbi:amino acid adenylation domain-containing protein [Streptomyces sp. B1866]|uniref:amino acid adenylation domain-containing protein n=1 Tax=Streptomyces sp. B1866 TaxID=3075431 RepID=UPI002891D946|nr:amino acid adenylation domain-containing protein [Streptomyces sp. B1866]MDT3399272.1 amino acid adenylation domain-containing protein [Streptomyces sp. B1866]
MTGASTLLVGVASPKDLVSIHVDIDDDLAPQVFVRSVGESLRRSLGREDFPCDPLVRILYDAEPTTQCVISLQPTGASRSFEGHLDYATDLWNKGEAERFVANYLAAVEQLVKATAEDCPGMTLADVRCISAQARKILEAVNDTPRVFPRSSVDELFRMAAERWPAVPAVRDAESTLTYSELAAAAAEQARLLRTAGVREGDTVLIAVPRSVAETVAVLGTLWAGATYIGVDLTQPPSHTGKIIAKAAPAAAIVADDGAGRLASHGVLPVSSWRRGWEADGAGMTPVRPDPDRLAYIAFTSGSTGEPKGVAIPHRAVIRLVHGADYLALGPGERCLRLSSLAFDASTVEIWGSLLTGASLEVCPPDLLTPGEIGAFLEERQITVAWLTAGLFRLVQEFAATSLGGLRQLLTGGDVVPHAHIKRALTENPGLVITNGYGPTENTTFTTVHSLHDPADIDGPIPIGLPVPGTRIYVLDDRARLLMPGAVGELYAAGEGLATGYLNDQAETERSFGCFSPDVGERLYRTGDLVRIDGAGRLCFLGRMDDQVKVRGFRIESGAISEFLTAQPEVEESVVTVTDGDSADKRIVAAVRLAPGTTVTPADLRDRVRDHLPSYMVPPLWAVVDRLPLTANGKIDRSRLAAIAMPAGSFAKQGQV